MEKTTQVVFYFDPICPWAWYTSLWMREVERVRPVAAEWKVFDLKAINKAHDTMPDTHAMSGKSLKMLVAARQEGGNEAIGRLYSAIGHARHDQKQDISEDRVLLASLEKAELDLSLLGRALNDTNTADEVRREPEEAATRHGVFGVPTLVIPGQPTGFFGPVISPAPTGEQAGLLWDHISWLLDQSWFYELKRGRK